MNTKKALMRQKAFKRLRRPLFHAPKTVPGPRFLATVGMCVLPPHGQLAGGMGLLLGWFLDTTR
jgi:hypothetical protein